MAHWTWEWTDLGKLKAPILKSFTDFRFIVVLMGSNVFLEGCNCILIKCIAPNGS